MLYPEQESALNHLHKVRIDMADWDKEKAFSDSEFLEAAWAVVVTHEPIIHSILDARRIHPSSDFVEYEDAVSFLKEAMLSDCWNYYVDHPSGAKFATYTRSKLHKRLGRFLALTRNSKMPYYVPLSINEKWVEDSIKRIQEKASKKPDYNSSSFSPEVQYREGGSEYDKSIRATLPVINAQYAMNARQVTELRRSFGEMGEQGEFTVDPFENVPDDIEFSTPFTDTVSDRAADRDAVASLYRLMSKVLTPREITILQLRFGLTPDGESYTFEAISNVFNLTRERIRQIQKKALRRLRGAFRNEISAVAELSDSLSTGRYRVQGRVYSITLKSDPKNVLRRYGGSLFDRGNHADNSLSIKTPYGWNVRVVGDDTFAPFVEEAKYDSEITLSLTVTEVPDDNNLVKAIRPDNAVLSTRKSVITYKRLAWLDQFQQIDDSL